MENRTDVSLLCSLTKETGDTVVLKFVLLNRILTMLGFSYLVVQGQHMIVPSMQGNE